MKKSIYYVKKYTYFVLTLCVLVSSLSVTAWAADRVEMTDIITACSIKYTSLRDQIKFTGSIDSRVTGATESVAQGYFYRNDRKMGFESDVRPSRDNASVTYTTDAQTASYQLDFYGHTLFGPANDETLWWASDYAYFDYPSDARSGAVQTFLLNNANQIMAELGFEPELYTATTISEREFPQPFVEYYFTLDMGSEHTRPIIYMDQADDVYYIVYQQGDGLNVIEEVTLSSKTRSVEEITFEHYENQGVRVDFK